MICIVFLLPFNSYGAEVRCKTFRVLAVNSGSANNEIIRTYQSDPVFLEDQAEVYGSSGNHANACFSRSLATVVMEAHVYGNAGNPDPTYYCGTNAMCDLVVMQEYLNFTVPAGYYETGVQIIINGTLSISGSANGGGGSAGVPAVNIYFSASFGSFVEVNPDQVRPDNSPYSVSYPFTLSSDIVPPGSNYRLSHN